MKLFELEIQIDDTDREKLEVAYKKGYRYIVNDEGIGHLCCFNKKPKKYVKFECWGYTDKDLSEETTLPAFPLEMTLENVKWTNRYPTLISDLLGIKENE